MRPPRRRLVTLLTGLLLVLSTACGGSGGGRIEWRDVTLTPPPGWTAYEQTTTVLGVANAALDAEGVRGERAVAAQFTHEPQTLPDDWRAFVVEVGGTLEVDESIEVDGVVGTRLVFLWESNGVPTREMVVVIPSRQIVILLQPVLEQGERDGPQRFLDHRETFDLLLDGIDFGAPLSD